MKSLSKQDISRNTQSQAKLCCALLGSSIPWSANLVEMHYLLTSPVILDDKRLEKLLGELPKTPYKQGIQQTLASIS